MNIIEKKIKEWEDKFEAQCSDNAGGDEELVDFLKESMEAVKENMLKDIKSLYDDCGGCSYDDISNLINKEL